MASEDVTKVLIILLKAWQRVIQTRPLLQLVRMIDRTCFNFHFDSHFSDPCQQTTMINTAANYGVGTTGAALVAPIIWPAARSASAAGETLST